MNELLAARNSENEEMLQEAVETVKALKNQTEAEISLQMDSMTPDEMESMLTLNDEV
jgi:hypothetical protein